MTERCDRCGLANVHQINLEMTFEPTMAEPVYALGKASVCFDCGFTAFSLTEEPFQKLRESVSAKGTISASAAELKDIKVA